MVAQAEPPGVHTIAGSSFNSSGQGGRRSSISGLDKDLQGLLAQLEADGHIIVNPIAHPPSQGPSSRHMMSSHGAPSSSFSDPLNARPPGVPSGEQVPAEPRESDLVFVDVPLEAPPSKPDVKGTSSGAGARAVKHKHATSTSGSLLVNRDGAKVSSQSLPPSNARSTHSNKS